MSEASQLDRGATRTEASRCGSGLCVRLLQGALVLGLLAGGLAQAQTERTVKKSESLDAAGRARITEHLLVALAENYVFPDVAKKMETHVRQQLKAGAYDKVTRPAEFAEVLTRDLRDISKDGHLRLDYIGGREAGGGGPRIIMVPKREPAQRERVQDNFGFEKVEILPGNVGYLDLRRFESASEAGATAVAAMNFLSRCDAIIIDLRRNGGGEPSMIQLLASYLFDEPMHLNSFYIRKSGTTQQFWTSAHVQGPRMSQTDVYVLTSSFTFSAAEEFAYDLQSLKRATIVGETTGGGAHPIMFFDLPDVHMVAVVPFGRAVNPVTGTNWEGVGVTPDLKVSSNEALETAHLKALEKMRAKAENEQEQRRLVWAMERTRALAKPVEFQPEVLQGYAGSYGTRRLILENGALYHQRMGGGPKLRMIPISDTAFMPEGEDMFRIEIEKDASGKATGLTWMSMDGRTDKAPRTQG